jgi:hypothetical protein
MKRLIVCCDGTWNNPEQEDNGIPAPTNVVKIHNAIADSDAVESIEQLKYYHPGVGGEGGALKQLVGGAFGAGISRHICSAYHWLGHHYEEGDHIYLFGFSRGAFTVRSLGGFLGCGLLNLKGLDAKTSWRRVHQAYDRGYRRKSALHADWAEDDWTFFNQRKDTPIRFLGVWDTVGALGIPDDLEWLNFFDNKKNWQFHNTDLGANITIARHAMALDEVRSSFSVTRWENASKHADAKEFWFPGVHSDVGGGYAETDLSHGALLWMMEESHQAGLRFRGGAQASIKEDPLGVMHNSFKGAFAQFRSRPRNIEAVIRENSRFFHPNVFKRQLAFPVGYQAYHPTRLLEVGKSHSVDIHAAVRWNDTGVYLPAGQSFVFSAVGQWKNSRDVCDWKGTEDGKLTVGDAFRAISSLLGVFEGLFKKLTGNESTDVLMTKRVEELNGFTLIGAITNDAGSTRAVSNDGSPVSHQYVALANHEAAALEIEHAGRLYGFPNDAWSSYENNCGTVRLTIRRVS